MNLRHALYESAQHAINRAQSKPTPHNPAPRAIPACATRHHQNQT
ncbi:hypothetical protein A2U01_0103054, partial [Trifolium medium]|nr:hypothetical protein [Trifolium medium]